MIKRILIIEDNIAFSKMLRVSLELEGYEVDETDNAILGCDRCFHKNYDLVFMDLFLPEKDGVTAIHELKENFSSDIKIIAMSGGSSLGRTEFILNLSKDHGADAILSKPFKIKELLNTIKNLESN